MCILGNHQSEDNFNTSESYSPFLKAPEGRLSAAIAAEYGCALLKTDTKRAFLHGDVQEDKVYVWWPQPIPEGHVLLLLKSIFGTKQAV